MPPSLQTIIDKNGRMRLNVYPFEGPYNCQGVFVELPTINNHGVYGEPYNRAMITALMWYANYGALSSPDINRWLHENGFIREAGDDIYVFDYIFRVENGINIYTITNLLGIRHPRTNNIIQG